MLVLADLVVVRVCFVLADVLESQVEFVKALDQGKSVKVWW